MSNIRYNFNGTQIQEPEAKLLYITSAKYGNDWHSTTHSHQCTELFYVLKGNGKFLVENSSFPVKTDDLVIVNPHAEHTEASLGEQPLEYIVLGIAGLIFTSKSKTFGHTYSIYNFSCYKDEVLFYLHALLKEGAEQDSNYEIICRNLLEILIINIIRRTNYALSIDTRKKLNKECAFVKRYIDDNFREDITLESLAESTYMNKFHLVHTFNKYMGISPINYLIEKRIEESKNLLATTDHSILQISSIIGFSSQSYFSQVFKKVTEKSPNQFRKEKGT